MENELRTSGIDAVAGMRWGTHFCHFYESRVDLLETLSSFFKAGLENNEFCVWVVSEPLTEDEARNALIQAVPGFHQDQHDHSLELISAREWYLDQGVFNAARVSDAWNAKVDQALARGYDGIRVSGNTAWVEEEIWPDFCEYEKQLNDSIGDQHMIALCTYSLEQSGAAEVLRVARNHQFVMEQRSEDREDLDVSELKLSNGQIKKLNDELEQRVLELTRQLSFANEDLAREIRERKRVEEVRHKFTSLVEESTDLIGIASFDHDVLFLNSAGQRMVGLDGDEQVRATSVLDYLVTGERDRFQNEVLPAVSLEGRWVGETIFRHFKTGAEIPMLQYIFFIKESRTGRRLALGTIGRDIGEHKRREQDLSITGARLADLTRRLCASQATAAIANEIDKSLNAIVANGNTCVRFLSTEAPDPVETRDAVESMITEAMRAAEMIRVILSE